jgi:ABC-type glycerol-3-phosphate transport system substrate-binding protein
LQATQVPLVSTPTADLVFESDRTPTPSAAEITHAPTSSASGTNLRIWVPSAFDPNGTTPASVLMKARLDQFTNENPGVRLEIRTKSLEGAGGMLDSLVAANVAAPLTLPDLVMVPRPLLESATLKGLLYPFDGLTSVMDEKAWYEYAHQLARVQSGTYCIPFAGDTMLLAYHPSLRSATSTSLEDLISLGEVLLFPATDPQALFTLNSYLAEGGTLQDEQGRPILDEAILTRVTNYDQQASQAGVMPYWLTQYSTDAQVWDSFLSSTYPAAITWSSSYLNHLQAGSQSSSNDLAAAPIPTLDGSSFNLASGWCWALAGQNAESKSMAVKLAEYLVDEKFMGDWTYAAGYLPPREDALQTWPDTELRQVMGSVSSSAQLLPPLDLLSSIGPALQQAVVDVLKAHTDPQTAAQTAANQVNKP